MARVVVLGAGFGGITAARELRAGLSREHEVVLVEQRDAFVMGLAKLWALDGRRPIERSRHSLANLRLDGIVLRRGRVERIDVSERTVVVAGEPVRFDRLVVALGADLAPQLLPGAEAGHNLYDPAAVPRLAQALQAFSGGRILFVIASMPFKCPPAPYEAAMLTASLLERRGVRDRTEIALATAEPRPLPVAPTSCSDDVKGFLRSRMIDFFPEHKAKRILAAEGTVEFENGQRKSFDLLVLVPPHQPPSVVRQSGLSDASGWIPVDPFTLATKTPGVYAVGDCTLLKTPSGKPLPKAGILAEAQAKIAAANIAAEVAGRSPASKFDGRGSCYIELGEGIATAVDGEFFALPEPILTLRMPTSAALREKERFEADRIAAWFSSPGPPSAGPTAP